MANITPLSRVETEYGQLMLAWLLQYSEYFRFVERRSGFELMATDFDLYPDDGETTVQKRGVGSGYTRRSEVPPARQSETLGFHGDSLTIDRSHLRDDELGIRPIGSWVPKRLQNMFRKWVWGMEGLVFQGTGVDDGTGREMLGLRNLLDGVTNVPGFNNTMVIDAVDFISTNPDSLDLSDPANQEALRKALEQILPNYPDAGIVLNRQLGSVVTGIAEDKVRYQDTPENAFGRVQTVFGSELVRVQDGTITNDEPDNAGTPNTDTTSLYIDAPMEMGHSLATNSGLYVEDKLDGEDDDEENAGRKLEWEMRVENAIQDPYSIVRIRNIKIAPGSEIYGDYGAA